MANEPVATAAGAPRRHPASEPTIAWDGGLALKSILGEHQPGDSLLAVVAERIGVAARHLRLSNDDLAQVFSRHSIFEGEAWVEQAGQRRGFIIVESHHLIEGMVGKGALKIVFPTDLLGEDDRFALAAPGVVEVRPKVAGGGWSNELEAEEVVKAAMREKMTGESLSMSLKCQATGAPFAGSEGLMLCAARQFDAGTGRYFLKPVVYGDDAHAAEDRELINGMMNATAEALSRAHRIGYDRIVHAAETNSTLTARLGLQLPTNVVEGHLRELLSSDPTLIIGDDDMTARLRELLAQPDYSPTRCALARGAAQMQMEHAILLPASRERLRSILANLPHRGAPSPAQYQELVNLFFGTGETQQNEDTLFHHREPLLRALSVALSVQCLDQCGNPEVLTLYLKTLLDNQRIMLETILLRKLPPGESLPVDWFERGAPLTRDQEARLGALLPAAELTRDQVADRFVAAANILFDALARVPDDAQDPYVQGRRELLDLAIGAITATGGVVPSVERLVFFTLPLIYECATPRLGVVTRKPAEVCGSELRPEAMAVGAVMAIEILLQRLTQSPRPLAGLTVAVEGLGNAGKNVVRIMAEKGATIVGVSDSRGAAIKPAGFSREELAAITAHKTAGRHLDSFQPALNEGRSAETALLFYPNPEMLKRMEADLLVLTAIPASITEQNARTLRVKVVCELTGAAVTVGAKQQLKQRQIQVVPDNLASSGGLLVSLSEMLQNSAAQVWARQLEETNLHDQLSRSYDVILKLAREFDVDIATASDLLALRRMQALAVYRTQLEAMAKALATRIQAIGPSEGVLVVCDDDEDGVASAAMLRTLIHKLNPAAAGHISFVNESFRSNAVSELMEARAATAEPVRHVFVLDRAYPTGRPGQQVVAAVAQQCALCFVNHHPLPAEWYGGEPASAAKPEARPPEDFGVLLISPQSLRATTPARQFPTAMILKELAHHLISDEPTLAQLDWQAAVGSTLEAPVETAGQWLLFYSKFNPDRTVEAARAIQTVTRAGGFLDAIHALSGVARPDQLETNAAWRRFMAEYKLLDERVRVLVEKIKLENRRKPFTAHFFTPEEVAVASSATPGTVRELDLYHWISERLTKHDDLAEKPIIAGQAVRDACGVPCLGVRIRSPRGVDLMMAGLPAGFETGGLPNTAVARLPLDGPAAARQVFDELVDRIWINTTGPLYLGKAGILTAKRSTLNLPSAGAAPG